MYVSEASTAGRELTIRPTLDRKLMDAGYTVVDAPAEATYIVQINYLRLSEFESTGDQTVKDAIEGAFFAGAGGTEVRYHETQIVSGASKINLELERGLPAMIGGLSRSLAGLLPTRVQVLADPSP